jgi:hypothetical protein
MLKNNHWRINFFYIFAEHKNAKNEKHIIIIIGHFVCVHASTGAK